MNAKRKKSDVFVLTGCLAAVMLAHLPALANHLVADSWVFMIPHSFAETLGYFFKSVIPPEWSALWLRPVPMFFFWLDTTIWSGTEWGPHLINIMFHLVNVWLIWNLMRFIRSRSKASGGGYYGVVPECAACLVYGLHPLATGSVTWVAARFDVMSVTFGLAGLLMWLRWEAGEKGRLLLWSILFLVAGILSKEQGIVFITVS